MGSENQEHLVSRAALNGKLKPTGGGALGAVCWGKGGGAEKGLAQRQMLLHSCYAFEVLRSLTRTRKCSSLPKKANETGPETSL